jgi:hypothetical protein
VLIHFDAISRLIDAARLFHGKPNDSEAHTTLGRALDDIAVAEHERDSYCDSIAEARKCYADEDCQIDEETVVSVGEDGVWVNAWVLVDLPSEPPVDRPAAGV